MIIGIVSGYFNPLHQGHIEYMLAARTQCEHLIAIINNDEQVRLKGSAPFMDENHRAFIVRNLRWVDDSIISIDNDKTVCESIRSIVWSHLDSDEIKFFNSGDRVKNPESKELKMCKLLGVKYVILPLPKKFSSGELIHKAFTKIVK